MTTTKTDEAPATDEERLAAREALLALSWEQQEDMRAEVRRLMVNFGKGALKWEEQGWAWEPAKDWKAAPKEWPPLARLLYLKVRLDAAEIRLFNLRLFPDRPHWCDDCGETPLRTNGMAWPCLNHLDYATQVQQLVVSLFAEAPVR